MTDAEPYRNVCFEDQSSIQIDLRQTGISMKFATVLAIVFSSVALPATAQDVQWELVDSGILNHSAHGKGIEIRIRPNPFPNGLFSDDNLDDILLALCNHYAPSVIPHVQQHLDIDNPAFVAVRIVTGEVVGRYVLEAHAISDGQCGDAL